MAFNNTVPVTLSVSHDSGTNLITFVITRYTPNSAGLYNVLFLTETIEILASACSHNEVLGQVVTVQNTSQDEFEITTGWYDAVNDVHYASPGQELVDLIDTYIAMNTGGGAVTQYEAISEAAALALAGSSGFEGGVVYRITCDGGTGGAGNGDYFYGTASSFGRLVCLQYYDVSATKYLQPVAEFTASGVVFLRGDAKESIDVNIDTDSSTTVNLAAYRMYGVINIVDAGSNPIAAFTGLTDDDEFTITSEAGVELNVTAMSILFPNGFVGNMSLAQFDRLTLRKSGSNLLVTNCTAEYSGGPREYVALLNQSGAVVAPTVSTVIKNTIGTITMGVNDVGDYMAQSAGLFTVGKTTANFELNSGINMFRSSVYPNGDANNVGFNSALPDGTLSDDIIILSTLTIQVYP